MFNIMLFAHERKGSFGQEFYYFEQLPSTNETAFTLANQGSRDGTVVFANEQTKGRGRKGKAWYSPRDMNLYFSLVVRPDLSQLPYVPFIAGLAVVEALGIVGLKSDLKWPNDILVSGKKISGVMIETSTEQNKLHHAVVGCGVNVNGKALPPELQKSATTIAMEKGSVVSRESLLASILFEFESLYGRMNQLPWTEFSRELEKHSTYLYGCHVRILQDGETFEGVTAGLDNHGGLILTMSNERKVFYAGDVEACRKN
jgi:BirA family transcriptional regulator, biotin operon repressor / biotin---[acetyl-CoA-carboxylase] ligase